MCSASSFSSTHPPPSGCLAYFVVSPFAGMWGVLQRASVSCRIYMLPGRGKDAIHHNQLPLWSYIFYHVVTGNILQDCFKENNFYWIYNRTIWKFILYPVFAKLWVIIIHLRQTKLRTLAICPKKKKGHAYLSWKDLWFGNGKTRANSITICISWELFVMVVLKIYPFIWHAEWHIREGKKSR